MNMRYRVGAIEEFDNVRFGGPTRVDEFDVAVDAVGTDILKNNPDRVMVIITNNGPDSLYWTTTGRAAFPNVNQLGTGQQEVFQVQNDGALCGVRIFGVASVAAAAVHVLALIRDHPA
jgi:hypothetical protein